MGIIIVAVLIAIISFIMALFSIKDLHFGSEMEKIFQRRKIKGSIVFYKDKITHYSSKSSSSSSSRMSEK